jgi:tRNA-dihydrouridine synthase
MSKVPADWGLIGQVREMRDSINPRTKIIGNGDVETRAQGEELAKKYKLDGIMIGRGIFKDPYLFANSSPWQSLDPNTKIAMYKKQVQLFIKTYKNRERNPATLKRYAKIYINGFDNASDIRSKIMECSEPSDMLEVIKDY